MNIRSVCLVLLLMTAASDPEHPIVAHSSAAFDQSFETDTQKLAAAGFESKLQAPSLGSSAGGEIPDLVAEMKQSYSSVETSPGESSVNYDVILQPGHFARLSGNTGATGKLVTEQQLAAFIVNETAKKLRSLHNKVLVVSADVYRPDLKTRVFLAVHADGAKEPCTTGPSLAYKSDSSLLAMHAIGWSLATATGYSYSDFRKDGFTANEARYYMFRKVNADRMTGLLEVGELTCSPVEKKLVTSAQLIGDDLASALDFISRTPNE